MNRRQLLLGAGGAVTASAVGLWTVTRSAGPIDVATRVPLRMPPLIDTTETGSCTLVASSGNTVFRNGQPTPTAGFNGTYLGPTIRMKRGGVKMRVENTLIEPITAHWHGLMLPGEKDGGPHQAIDPGSVWEPELEIDQAPSTAWYHPHVHGRTAIQVHSGLAGIIHVTDGRDDDRGLPSTYGLDDQTVVLQDRNFDEAGRMTYSLSMMTAMHGSTGDTMLVNGQPDAVAVVPRGIARFRLVNGSNSRIYSLFLDDRRPMHLVATEGGFLRSPIALEDLVLSPGERAEILLDMSDGRTTTLMSGADPNQGPNGMFGRVQPLLNRLLDRSFPILPIAVDDRLPTHITALPASLDAAAPAPSAEVAATRRISLDMGLGAMMGMAMFDNGNAPFGINGRAFDAERIDIAVKRDTTERWTVESPMLQHPFHVHGTMFQVLSEEGQPPRPESSGWKDTVLVRESTELLVRFEQPAPPNHPFMFHCHILEHEDRGMMGQLTVI